MPIKLGLPEGLLHAAPTLVAVGRGYFARYGLDVQPLNAGSHYFSIPAIASGEVDVSPQGPLIDFFRAWDPARPMIWVADQGSVRSGHGEAAIVARPALVEAGELADYADLKGKRIGLSHVRGDHDWMTFGAALRKGGLRFDDVDIVTCDFGEERHRALAEGRIDLATVGRLRSQLRGRESGAFVVWRHEHEFRERQERAITFSYRFWTERPDEAQRFVTAYLHGLRDYYDAFERGIDRDGVLEVLAQQSGEPFEALATDMVPSSVDPDGHLHTEAIRADLDFFREQGLLEHDVLLDRLIDEHYLDVALEDLGPVGEIRQVRSADEGRT
jgi:NitT/TauT family transport system substrate-binding protein